MTDSTYSTTATAQVHYWELSNYNNGVLVGRWFTLDGLTAQEHQDERSDWLESLPEDASGYQPEEWILGDAEGVPTEYVNEYGISAEFFELQEAIDNSHLDAEIFTAGIACGIPIESIEDAYYGSYSSYEELAEEYADGTGMIAEVPESLRFYFDMEAFGRDLAMDFLEHDSHYFHNNW